MVGQLLPSLLCFASLTVMWWLEMVEWMVGRSVGFKAVIAEGLWRNHSGRCSAPPFPSQRRGHASTSVSHDRAIFTVPPSTFRTGRAVARRREVSQQTITTLSLAKPLDAFFFQMIGLRQPMPTPVTRIGNSAGEECKTALVRQSSHKTICGH